jgi:plastocyanin
MAGMRSPRRMLFISAALLALAAAVVPAVALSESAPTISAVNAGIYGHYWSPASATIGENGSVTISNPTEIDHGVEWVGGPTTPTCSAGVPVGKEVSGAKWTGTCAFSAPGVYTFYCTVHGPEMTGTVTVSANGTTTMTMAPPTAPPASASTPTTTTTTPLAPSSARSSSPLAGSVASALKLAALQRGATVHGSVAVSDAGVGGRLQIELLAKRTALASAASAGVQVGRVTRSALHAGVVSFAVVLDKQGRRALRHAHRLALSVKIALTPASGAALTLSRAVVLRG